MNTVFPARRLARIGPQTGFFGLGLYPPPPPP
jgi:hypothetical protein